MTKILTDDRRRKIAMMLRRMARRIDKGCILRVTDEILPDDVYFIFRGVDPENPIDRANPAATCEVVVKVVGDD